MSHISLTYHIIWRTHRSERTISEEHERDLYAYIMGICNAKKCHLYRINSMPDHLHLCLEVHPTLALSEFVQVVKQESSRWSRLLSYRLPAASPHFVRWKVRTMVPSAQIW